MKKTILITGSTDGIGQATAEMLASEGHTLLLHGRNPAKLEATKKALSVVPGVGCIETYVADLSRMNDVEALVKEVSETHSKLDVLINNAGVYKTPNSVTTDGYDVRFVVNTIAPYFLTQQLLPLMDKSSRVINLSSAAQAPVDPKALNGQIRLGDMEAYSQSKLAIVMWTRELTQKLDDGPSIIAVNPGSLLATKMVKEGFGMVGNDLGIGADILRRLAISSEFSDASGKYFDNDSGQFTSPHPDALNSQKSKEIVRIIEAILVKLTQA